MTKYEIKSVDHDLFWDVPEKHSINRSVSLFNESVLHSGLTIQTFETHQSNGGSCFFNIDKAKRKIQRSIEVQT